MMNDEIDKRLKSIEKNSCEALKRSREFLYAAVFNNTISGSTWLKDPSFSPTGWAVGYPYLYVLYRVLNEMRPKRILDIGLGQTSKMIAQYAAANPDVEHLIVEASRDWEAFYLRANSLSPNSRVVRLEYCMKKIPGFKEPVRHYKYFKSALRRKTFDFISIDAPYAGDMREISRIDVASLIPGGIANSFVIMLDDTNRPQERAAVDYLVSALRTAGRDVSKAVYRGLKECSVIVSADNAYFKTM